MPFASQNQKAAKMQHRNQYAQTWLAPLLKTCPSHPGFFCFAMFCASCASYSNRKKALHGDMTRYICCAGHCPCSGKMKEQSCPECCLCLEVFICFAQSVVSTRWLIQDKLRIQNTKCDNCIIGTMVFLQYLSCICNIVACLTDIPFIDDAAQVVDCAADIAWCSVCACMQTQVRYEMNKNERWIATDPAARLHTAAPPGQQMVRPGGKPTGYGGPPPAQQMQYPGAQAAAAPPGYPAIGGAAPGAYPTGQAPQPPPGYPQPPPGYPRA